MNIQIAIAVFLANSQRYYRADDSQHPKYRNGSYQHICKKCRWSKFHDIAYRKRADKRHLRKKLAKEQRKHARNS